MPYRCSFASGFCYAGSYRALFMPYGSVSKNNVQNAGQTFPEGRFSLNISGALWRLGQCMIEVNPAESPFVPGKTVRTPKDFRRGVDNEILHSLDPVVSVICGAG